VLFRGRVEKRSVRLRLGLEGEHTVYEAEVIGLLKYMIISYSIFTSILLSSFLPFVFGIWSVVAICFKLHFSLLF